MNSFSNQVLGIIGGGQLARMICLEAQRMNLRTVVWTGALEAPATDIANVIIDLPFDSPEARAQFAQLATVATVEFENIPRETLEAVNQIVPLHPSPQAISICQNREREKLFLLAHDIPCAPFFVVSNADELKFAMVSLNGPAVLKTADFGYDGKGQLKLNGSEDAQEIWAQFDAPRAVLEAFVSFEKELSIMAVRGADGSVAIFDPAENRHRHHILDVSIVPASVAEKTLEQAKSITQKILQSLDYQGLIGIEFFVLSDGSLIVNEMAPRPHNSGHHTLDACATSQFEQQIRAVCGLALGSTRLLTPVVMLNLLGDLWKSETEAPNWQMIFDDSEAYLHLYGKKLAKGRRKMGHINFLGANALERAEHCKAQWLNHS